MHRRDAECAEDSCFLCALCVSAVSLMHRIFRSRSFSKTVGNFYTKLKLRSKSAGEVAAALAVSSVIFPAR
jgi:hypothetical protein